MKGSLEGPQVKAMSENKPSGLSISHFCAVRVMLDLSPLALSRTVWHTGTSFIGTEVVGAHQVRGGDRGRVKLTAK